MTTEIYALDTETGPYPQPPGTLGAWALEPYRDEFYMKMIGIAGPNDFGAATHMNEVYFLDRVNDIISSLVRKKAQVYCHNTIFDICVLMSHLGIEHEKLSKIRWRDTSLLAKWLNNSQKDEKMRYSLRNCVEKWLPDSERKQEFLALKDNIEDDYDYWLNRVIEDCHMTRELAIELERLLPDEQYNGYVIECKCLYPLAKGYMTGIHVDPDVVDEMLIMYQAKVNSGLRELGVKEDIIRSPKKLGELLFDTWGLEPHSYTASGAPSTKAGDLKHIALASGNEKIKKILEVKKAATVISKYVKGFKNAIAYLNEDVLHPIPRLFNSYTGRMTYNSKLFKKHQVGIAFHQLPRKDKDVKRALVAKPGYKFFYSDFAAQELRLMAQFSQDENMLSTFNEGRDLHSVMTETIYGIPYDDVVEGNHSGDSDVVDKRNCGKLTNLSSMYRIGGKSLQSKFFEDYDRIINLREANHYLNSYKKTFRGVPRYWNTAIEFARANKYAASLSNRRFGITNMDWKGESSAINMPIQGSGIDLAELQIALVSEEYPQMIFQIQVHDSLTWLIPEDMDPIDIKIFINNIDYGKYYGIKLKLPFPMDCAVGTNLANMENI